MVKKRWGKTDFYIFHVGNAAAAETLVTADTGGTLRDGRLRNQGFADSPDFQWISHNPHSFQDLEAFKERCLLIPCQESWDVYRTKRPTYLRSPLICNQKKSTPQSLIDANHSWVWVKTIAASGLCQRGKFLNSSERAWVFFLPSEILDAALLFVVVGRFTIVLVFQKAQGRIKPFGFLARESKILTTSEILGSWGGVCHASYAKQTVKIWPWTICWFLIS